MHFGSEELLERVERRLESNPRLRLTQLSRDLGIDRHAVEAAARQATGNSFRDFRQVLLMEKAFLLMNTDPGITLEELSNKLDYHPQALSRFLRCKSGETFHELRESARTAKFFATTAK